jgi:hypothetical protein
MFPSQKPHFDSLSDENNSLHALIVFGALMILLQLLLFCALIHGFSDCMNAFDHHICVVPLPNFGHS